MRSMVSNDLIFGVPVSSCRTGCPGHQMGRVNADRAASLTGKVSALILSCLLLFACGNVAAGDESFDDQATPIPYGYLFFDYRFIPGPYVIVASGQQVTVNGIVVSESSATPHQPKPQEKAPAENIPPPPPRISGHPGDAEKDSEDYWRWRREAILANEKDLFKARALLIQEMNTYYRRTVAIPDPEGADSILSLFEYEGEQIEASYSMRDRFRAGFTDDDPVRSAIEGKASFADLLRRVMWKNQVIWLYGKGSGVAALNPDLTAQFLQEMLVEDSPDVRYANLVRKGIIPPWDDLWIRLVHGMKDLDPLRNEMRARKERLIPKREPPTALVTPPAKPKPVEVKSSPAGSNRPAVVTPIDNSGGEKIAKPVSYARMVMGGLIVSACLILFYLLFFRRRA